MRQAKKEIKNTEVIVGLLGSAHTGRLGTIGRDGYPMVKPLNFAYNDRRIYFHSAREGEKMDDLKRDNRVCFEVDLPIAFVKGDSNPCKAEYLYRSVIIKGKATIVDEPGEKTFGLRCLLEKYQPEGGYGDFSEEKLAITAVVRIDVEEMTGKEDLGKDDLKEAALNALKDNKTLPVVLTRTRTSAIASSRNESGQ